VHDDAQQTKNILRDAFGYDNTTAIETARLEFQETLLSLDPALDAGPAHGSALRDFYRVVIGKILAAVDDRLVPDQAIIRVLEAMQRAMPQLSSDLQAAQDIDAIKAAYENYDGRFRDAVMRNIPIAPDEPQGAAHRKKVLIDLLFSIGTH
jgi:phospholipid N-methyltransferase